MYRVWDKSKPPSGPFRLNRDSVRAQGLIAWYPMGGISGPPTVYDGLGSNHFTPTALTMSLGSCGEPVGVYNGSSSFLQSSVVPIYTAPLSVGVWFLKNSNSDTTSHGLSSIGDYTLGVSNPRRFQFDTAGGTGDTIRWLSVGSSVGVASKSGIVSKKWHHTIGMELSTTSRYVGLDGVLSSQDTTSATPGGTQNRFTIGCIFDSNVNQGFFGGQIGEVCVWNKSNYGSEGALSDPGTRFELWYPLRGPKWISIPAAFARKPIVYSQAVNRAALW